MKKRIWEMAVGILYILILIYQVAKTETVKIVCEIPGEAPAGSRIRVTLDLSGCRGKSLVLRLAYDGSRLGFCGKAQVGSAEECFVLIEEAGMGTGENCVLEISAFFGEGYLGRGSVTLEFFAKHNCEDVPAYIKLVTFHGVGKIEYDNKGLSGVPYPALHSDSVVLEDFDFSDFS